MLAQPINLQASDGSTDFIDIPAEQIDIKTSSENETTVFAEESLASCDLGIGINKNGDVYKRQHGRRYCTENKL